MKKRLISISVYGSDPTYLEGALENARLVPRIYPGWVLRVFLGPGIDPYPFEEKACETVSMAVSRGHGGMMWRFLPAWEEGIDRVIFRDADSRVDPREAAAVEAWVRSGLKAHAMHDHEHHRGKPLLGGMWGVRGGVLPMVLAKRVERLGRSELKHLDDMKFLERFVHPRIEKSLLRHSSVPLRWPWVEFPRHRRYDGFVGEQIGRKRRKGDCPPSQPASQ